MFDSLPSDYTVALDWGWDDWKPYFDALLEGDLSADSIDTWLKNRDKVGRLMWEVGSRINVATTLDTTDDVASNRLRKFMSEVNPNAQRVNFQLDKQLVASGLAPDSIKIPLRNTEASIKLFNEDNLPLISQLSDLGQRYNKIAGAQTVMWDGEEKTISQVSPLLKSTDRDVREKVYHLVQDRLKQDREAHNEIWREYMDVRKQMYQNLGLDNFRQYAWLSRNRHDYTPEDAIEFTEAIAEVVVPATERLNNIKREKLGYETLKPWDAAVDADGRDPLKAYETIQEFIDKTEQVFEKVDPELGAYFSTMKNEGLLDLENRKGKGPGGYCTYFPLAERPFIFMNAVGFDSDVRTLLHEAGHAFHGFSRGETQYLMQRQSPMEFNEVASMAMELLASPYVTEDQGGYFTQEEAARYQLDHLRGILSFWPYMAVVVAFQHWIYTHHEAATNPDNCDKKWLELWHKYMKGVDYSGYEDDIKNRWRRQLHIFVVPFYYIEYGVAQLGSVQVWANALKDQQAALDQYRAALALGGTVTLPELYETAGAKLSFDAKTLGEAVDLIENTMRD
ncbi:MAG: M3 family oligoendopeptidase, partial [Phototrophicaceae bacterium]